LIAMLNTSSITMTDVAITPLEPQEVPDEGAQDVIQSITHDEPAALRDEDDLVLQADSDWSDNVAANILRQQQGANLTIPELRERNEDVVCLRFGSAPGGGDGLKHFRAALLNGPQLSQNRIALGDAGYSCEISGGALMFVKPEQAAPVLLAVENSNLHHFHVVVSESLEYLIEEVLKAFSFQTRPKVKSGERGRSKVASFQIDAPIHDHSTDTDHELQWVVLVQDRTFLSWRRQLQDANSVVRSTTEAVSSSGEGYFGSHRGLNPRRFD